MHEVIPASWDFFRRFTALASNLPALADAMVEELFRGDAGYAQESVIPPLFQQTSNEQQAATFSGQQFPSSYSSYLAKGGAQGQQGQQQAQAGRQLHQSGSQGSGSSDTAQAQPKSTQEVKQQRVREKNRRAMKKFRERQKVLAGWAHGMLHT